MSITEHQSELGRKAEELARVRDERTTGPSPTETPSHPLWRRMRELGTELWLDSGDIDAISEVWTREFTGLTTNNTLLNREVQKGEYDDLMEQAWRLLEGYSLLSESDRRLEVAFILNTHHALRLVKRFDARVSVEEHTALTDDLKGAINYARRFHAICPERFYVKIPYSAAGLLATRRLSDEGIAVNQTLGFSARQNYLTARIARPAFVNVFLGRLNSFVADNAFGPGRHVGQRATLASQIVLRVLRDEGRTRTRQIAASLREGQQVADLAGVDVITMPPRVAKEFLELGLEPEDLQDRTAELCDIEVDPEIAEAVRLDTLWQMSKEAAACADALEQERLAMFTPTRLKGFFQRHRCADLLVKWTDRQVQTSAAEGKIPDLATWQEDLAEGRIGLDSLMTLAGWNSFHADQEALDRRVETTMARAEG
jgi:transaldolase